MEARLAENPREVVTLRVQQDTAKGERHGEVCQRQMTQARTASDDPDLQYLAARCGTSEAVRDRAYLEGWRKWPRNAWFGYAAGYALADEGAYGEALAALEVVWRHAPPLADGAALLSARIRKMLARSESADISDLLAFSPRLREYHQVEIGQNIDGGWRLAFARLAQGRLEEALTAAKGSQDETHILRLVAASDGAPPDAVRKALALPASSASGFDAWLGCALALRHGLDVEAYRQSIRSLWGENGEPMARFVELVHSGEITAADEEVKKLPIERRLQAYVFGVIAAGPRAPDQWRENARFMMFSLERPYFR
jgi:hypothetical protein